MNAPDFFAQLQDYVRAGTPVVLALVTGASGSTPRKAGAHMLVTLDAAHGTVGGGAIEQVVITRARELLATGGATETLHRHLTRDLAMCCGGAMTIVLDPIVPAPQLVIFGAGHVARALVPVAQAAGFALTVCDGRDEWLGDPAFAAVRRIAGEPTDAVAEAMPGPSSAVLVCTHDHALDEEILVRLLRLPSRPAYIGVIGSRRKRERFRDRLLGRGFAPEVVAAMRMPVGLNLGGNTPGEIAVAVVAELVAWRHGHSGGEPW